MIVAEAPASEVSLRKSGGGVFEITVDGTTRFSKRASGRFPSDDELLAAIT